MSDSLGSPRAALLAVALALVPALAAPPRAAAASDAPAASARPAPVELKISAAHVLAPVKPEVLRGYDFGNWMRIAMFAEDLRAVRPAHLRFPAAPDAGDAIDLSEATLIALQSNVTALGNAPVVIQTRVLAGGLSGKNALNRPEDAASAVRWARDHRLQVAAWEIGNQPDRYATAGGDPTFTAERYCAVFRAQAAAMKAVDPGVRVAGPAVSGTGPASDAFLEAFVKACGDAVDVLSWQLYPTDGTLPDAEALAAVTAARRSVDHARAVWADPARNPKGHARTVPLAVTSYALSSKDAFRARHLEDMVGAMWAMETALRLDEAGVDLAHYFAIQNTYSGLLDGVGARRASYYAFATLSVLSGALVEARTADPDLWVHAALDGGRLDVIVTNTAVAPRAVATAVAGFELKSGEWFDEAIARDEKPPAEVGARAVLELAPRSITHLVYARR